MDTSPRPQPMTQVIQRMLFAPLDAVPEELYVLTSGQVACTRTTGSLGPWSSLSTCTYFGRVPVSYVQRWTTVTAVDVVMTVSGRGRVRVMADDHLSGSRIVSQEEFDSEVPLTLRLQAPVDRYLEAGHIWVEASTTHGHLTVGDVRVDAVGTRRPRSASVVICTYNRPTYCTATLARIASDPAVLDLIDRIVVVDQGSALVTDAQGFGEVARDLGERLHVVQQGNFGGAGGFTRGLIELRGLSRSADFAAILMDDDIQLEPESLLRLVAFDAQRRDPTIIGGQMLKLFHPSVLLTHGEQTDFSDLRGGVPVDHEVHGVDLLETLPARRIDVEYNAWWLCLVPSELLDKVGLPLPIFFQGDDIELGLRAREVGVQTVTLPGAAVWHADFEFKDWDSPIAFFAIRNALINAALHTDLVPSGVVEKLAIRLRHQLIEYRYGLTATILFAIEQFLAGPAILDAGGAEDLEAVMRLRAKYPDTHRLTAEEVRERGLGHVRLRQEDWVPDDADKASLRRFIGQLRGRVMPEVALPSLAPWWQGSSFRTIVATDCSQDAFRVRSLSRRETLRQARECRRVLRRLRREGPRVVEAWRAARPELTSEKSWRTLLGLV
ncbi:MAG: glycosyltransferase [Aeromicrobium sp.]|uniref:glycosyltransferase n=1 Tax=Aeromicrobium sp. TaxID=1871063 RepID=UPI0039E57B21